MSNQKTVHIRSAAPTQVSSSDLQAEQGKDHQIEGLSNLVLLQSRARAARGAEEVGFIAVNDTRLLVPYDLAVIFSVRPGQSPSQGRIIAASDVSSVDLHAPLIRWLNVMARGCLSVAKDDVVAVSASDARVVAFNDEASTARSLAIDAKTIDQWREFAAEHALWLPLQYSDTQPAGGILLFRKRAWGDPEVRILRYWQDTLSHALNALASAGRVPWVSTLNRVKRRFVVAALLLAGLLMCMPVKLSVLAPAEVIPVDPSVVRAPLNGLIQTVVATPNQRVETGDVLLLLDTTSLQTRLEVAQQSLAIAQAQFHQTRQAAFRDVDAKSTLALMQLKIDKQRAEVDYVKALIARSEIKAQQAGVAIFSNPNEMVGKAVSLGERLLTIADPDAVQLKMWLPVGDDIRLNQGDEIRLFPTVSPEKYFIATLSAMAYQAQVRPHGLAYRLTGVFQEADTLPRIGQRGVARITGEKVSVFYYLFRRPIAYVRQKLGW